MNKWYYIFKNEFLLFFLTPIAYVIMFAFYAVNGILFWYLVNKANIPGEYVDGSIMLNITNGIVFWLTMLLLIPLLSMRLIAYESESKRLNHLFSTPVKTWQITLGKFFGGFLFYILLWLPTLMYAFILNIYSKIDFGPIFTAYLGIFLFGAFAISIGLFASSLSKNQILSAIISFSIFIVFLMVSIFETLMKVSWIKKIFAMLNYVDQFTPFCEGLLDTRSVVFFISFTLFFLISANEIINYRRFNND